MKALQLARVLLLAQVIAGVASAQLPDNTQFQVNTYTTSSQIDASVGGDEEGGFVVVWTSNGSTGSDHSNSSIQGQRYAPDAAPVGDQFQVNSYTANQQLRPSIAASHAGEFVVAWSGFGSSGGDSSAYSIQGRRFASNGTPAGPDFQVNTSTRGMQDFSAVASSPDGGFMVVWHSDESLGDDSSGRSIQGQRYAADGERAGDEHQLNSTVNSNQKDPDLSVDPGGGFVVVWVDTSDVSVGEEIRGRRFGPGGEPAGGEFAVNTFTQGNQYNPAVAVGPAGNFVVVWSSNGSSGSDTSGYSVQVRAFAPDGMALADQFQVNSFTESSQTMPEVAAEPTGGFLVVWRSGSPTVAGPDGEGEGIATRRLRWDGTFRGDEFVVNDHILGLQSDPSAVVTPDGRMVFTWVSSTSPGTDSSAESIQARLFSRDNAVGPEAWFRWDPPQPVVGDRVHFFDASVGEPHSWLWQFGDGATDSGNEPGHEYREPGMFTVSLEVAGPTGSDSVQRWINVAEGAGPEEDGDLALPAVARIAGASAFFTSRVVLFNAGPEVLLVEVLFTPRADVGGPLRTAVLELQPRALQEVEDPLAVWFDVGPAETTVGTLVFTVLEGEAERLLVHSVVFARNLDGSEYGQFLAAVRREEALVGGQSAYLSTSPDPARSRINVGVMAFEEDTVISVTPTDPIGQPLTTGHTVCLNRGESYQLNDVHTLFGLGSRADFLVAIEVESGRAVAYGSVIDGTAIEPGTNDPTTVMPVRAGSPQVVLLELGSVHGINEFAGSASVTNHSTAEVQVQATLYRRDDPGVAATANVRISGGDTVGYRDLVGELFDLTNTVGTVKLDVSPGGLISATGREYAIFRNASGEITGTAGQQMPGLTAGSLLSPATTAHLIGLKQTGDASGTERSHLAAFNPGDTPAELTVILFDAASGAMEGVLTRNVGPEELTRLNSVVELVNPEQDGQVKRLEVTTTAPLLVLAYRVNPWGDPYTIPPMMEGRSIR